MTEDICVVCAEEYPPNGILMCDDCGRDGDIEIQREEASND